jgi:hypothetical protein
MQRVFTDWTDFDPCSLEEFLRLDRVSSDANNLKFGDKKMPAYQELQGLKFVPIPALPVSCSINH